MSNKARAFLDTCTIFAVAGLILCTLHTKWQGLVAYIMWILVVIVKPDITSTIACKILDVFYHRRQG